MSHRTARKILHVDDDPDFLRITAHRLRAAGYTVESVAEPSQTIPKLITTDSRVVLLDIHFPDMNGIEVLRTIKQFDGGIQVIVLTGTVTITTAMESMRLGAEACYFKPIQDWEPLVESLEATFSKLDFWWQTLNDLSIRRLESHTV